MGRCPFVVLNWQKEGPRLDFDYPGVGFGGFWQYLEDQWLGVGGRNKLHAHHKIIEQNTLYQTKVNA